MSEKPQSERYCKTCGDRHLPPTGSKCPRVSSISPTKLAARFMNLDVDRGAGFTDHEGAVGNDSAEQWDTAFPTKPNKPSADPGTDPSHLQTMVRSHQNQLATLQNMMGSLVSTVDKMAARLHKTARKSGDTSSDSSSSGSEEADYTPPPSKDRGGGPFQDSVDAQVQSATLLAQRGTQTQQLCGLCQCVHGANHCSVPSRSPCGGSPRPLTLRFGQSDDASICDRGYHQL